MHRIRPPRLRFSLRTLFVLVTLVACWFGYYWNWIRQRYEVVSTPRLAIVGLDKRPPFFVWLIGEPGYDDIMLSKTTDHFQDAVSEEEGKRIAELFPEARVWFFDHSESQRLIPDDALGLQ